MATKLENSLLYKKIENNLILVTNTIFVNYILSGIINMFHFSLKIKWCQLLLLLFELE